MLSIYNMFVMIQLMLIIDMLRNVYMFVIYLRKLVCIIFLSWWTHVFTYANVANTMIVSMLML
jgi:hypothetical protein